MRAVLKHSVLSMNEKRHKACLVNMMVLLKAKDFEYILGSSMSSANPVACNIYF